MQRQAQRCGDRTEQQQSAECALADAAVADAALSSGASRMRERAGVKVRVGDQMAVMAPCWS